LEVATPSAAVYETIKTTAQDQYVKSWSAMCISVPALQPYIDCYDSMLANYWQRFLPFQDNFLVLCRLVHYSSTHLQHWNETKASSLLPSVDTHMINKFPFKTRKVLQHRQHQVITARLESCDSRDGAHLQIPNHKWSYDSKNQMVWKHLRNFAFRT
jgi:hypothetical protein